MRTRVLTKPKGKAFTLVELLVVVAIIALLVSILVPSLQLARAQADVTVCLTNLRSLALGVQIYFADGETKDLGPASVYQHHSVVYGWTRTGVEDWIGLGLLFKTQCITAPQAFYCPTYYARWSYEEYEDLWFNPEPWIWMGYVQRNWDTASGGFDGNTTPFLGLSQVIAVDFSALNPYSYGHSFEHPELNVVNMAYNDGHARTWSWDEALSVHKGAYRIHWYDGHP